MKDGLSSTIDSLLAEALPALHLPAKSAPRADLDTLTAGNAVSHLNGQSLASILSDRNTDGAVKTANAALHAAAAVRHDPTNHFQLDGVGSLTVIFSGSCLK